MESSVLWKGEKGSWKPESSRKSESACIRSSRSKLVERSPVNLV